MVKNLIYESSELLLPLYLQIPESAYVLNLTIYVTKFQVK